MEHDQRYYDRAIDYLRSLIAEARQRGDGNAASAALASATTDGRPSVRTVDVVRVAASGLAILANRQSGKGRQMEENPRAALCFHWAGLQYQAIVEGTVLCLPDEEAEALWRIQPRAFGLGHWASDQTGPEQEPVQLQSSVRELRQRFKDERIPKPQSWSAYEIRPDRIDFWATGWTRLRPRIRCLKDTDGRWSETRENP